MEFLCNKTAFDAYHYAIESPAIRSNYNQKGVGFGIKRADNGIGKRRGI